MQNLSLKYELRSCLSLPTSKLLAYVEEFHAISEKCTVLRWMEEVGAEQWMVDKATDMNTDFVAFLVNGKIVGIGRVTKKPWHVANGNFGYAIRPSKRRQGFATAFLAMMKRFCLAHGMPNVTACVDVTNIPSIKAFERAGWKRTGRMFDWTPSTRTAMEFVVESLADERGTS